MEMFKLSLDEIEQIEEVIESLDSSAYDFTCDYAVAFSKNCNGICGNISNKKTKK